MNNLTRPLTADELVRVRELEPLALRTDWEGRRAFWAALGVDLDALERADIEDARLERLSDVKRLVQGAKVP